ncbi:MAG: HAMP domain-containing sensor histidine kinase [Phototrophicaceae bacterium]
MTNLWARLWEHQILPIINTILSFILRMDIEQLINLATFKDLEQSPQEQYRTNVIIGISIATAILSSILILFGSIGILFNVFDNIPSRIITLFAIPISYLLVIITALRFPWQDKIKRLTQLIISSSFIAIAIATFFSGGLFGTPIFGLIVVFITATMLMTYRSVVMLYGLMIIYLFILLFAEITQMLPSAPAKDLPVQMIALIAAFTISFLLITYYKYAIQEAERKLATLQKEMIRLETQSELTIALTHDLRTPLSILKSTAYIIKKKQEKNKPIDDNIKVIDDTANHINMLIEDLLELTFLDEKTVLKKRQSIQINTLLQQVIDKLTRLATLKQITLLYPSLDQREFWIAGNTAQLSRAFENIIENAIHFNVEGGTVTITLQQIDQNIHIAIADTGIGIAQEHHKRIFERFFKVDSARTIRENEGTGIGLSLASQIIHIHSGKITVKSTLSEGTMMTVILPIATQAISGRHPMILSEN